MKRFHIFLLSVASVFLLFLIGYTFLPVPPARAIIAEIAPSGTFAPACPLVVPVCPYGGHSVIEPDGCSETVCNITPPAVPTASISASSQIIPLGQAATITWTSTNATACTASDSLGSDSLAASGSLFESPAGIGSYTYTVTCSGPGGTSNPASVTVSVLDIASTVPEITGIVPASGVAGATVTVAGLNFTSSNQINIGAGSSGQGTYVTVPEVPSSDGGTSLSFTMPSVPGATSAQNISIENANGTSNVVSYTLSGSASSTPVSENISSTQELNLTAVASGTSAILSWTAYTPTGMWGYNVYRSTTSGFTPNATNNGVASVVGGTSYTNTGLAPGTYYYVVAAVNTSGTIIGIPSAQVAVTIASASTSTTTPAPTVTIGGTASLVTNSTTASVVLEWSSQSATSCTASGAWSGAQPLSGESTQIPASVGTSTYTITCSGAGGSDSASAIVNASSATTTPVASTTAIIPPPTTSASTSVSQEEALLVSLNTKLQTLIIRACPLLKSPTLSEALSSCSGPITRSPLKPIKLTPLSISSIPTNLQATGETSSTISLSWQPPAGVVSYYGIYRDNIEVGTTTATTFTDTGLVPMNNPTGAAGGEHLYYVVAYGATSASSESVPIQASAAISPSSVTGLSASVSGDTVTLHWNPSTVSNGVGSIDYIVYRSTTSNCVANTSTYVGTGGFSWSNVNNAQGAPTFSGESSAGSITEFMEANLPPGTYYYCIQSQDTSEGTDGSPISSPAEATIASYVDSTPSIPLNFIQTSATASSITLSWSSSMDAAGGMQYIIYGNDAGYEGKNIVPGWGGALATVSGTTFTDTIPATSMDEYDKSLPFPSPVSYGIVAIDSAGHISRYITLGGEDDQTYGNQGGTGYVSMAPLSAADNYSITVSGDSANIRVLDSDPSAKTINIYRTNVSGCAEAPANLLASGIPINGVNSTAIAQYDNVNIPAGIYYYCVAPVDSLGNVGQVWPQEKATITGSLLSASSTEAMIEAIENATTTQSIISAAQTFGFTATVGSSTDASTVVVIDPTTGEIIGSFVEEIP